MNRVALAGLGNPGPKYALTRHNMGFMVADAFAQAHSWRFTSSRFNAELAKGEVGGLQVFLIKPQTFMNLSGRAVQLFLSYYKIPPSSLLAIHDDLDMPLGRLKFVRGGGAGGHNGVRSLIESLGTREFPRLKLGIGRPGPEFPVDKYVLSSFALTEMDLLEKVIAAAVEGVETFLELGLDHAMNRFNGLDIGLA